MPYKDEARGVGHRDQRHRLQSCRCHRRCRGLGIQSSSDLRVRGIDQTRVIGEHPGWLDRRHRRVQTNLTCSFPTRPVSRCARGSRNFDEGSTKCCASSAGGTARACRPYWRPGRRLRWATRGADQPLPDPADQVVVDLARIGDAAPARVSPVHPTDCGPGREPHADQGQCSAASPDIDHTPSPPSPNWQSGTAPCSVSTHSQPGRCGSPQANAAAMTVP